MFGMLKNLRTHMKWIMITIVVAFLLSTFLMYEGRSGRRGPSRSADGTMTDYEVAAVDGRPLMRSELENRLRAYSHPCLHDRRGDRRQDDVPDAALPGEQAGQNF